jgi:hypothetical protein
VSFKKKFGILLVFAVGIFSSYGVNGASAAVVSRIFDDGHFTYQVPTDNSIYPSANDGATDLYFHANSWSSVKSGDYMVYLQRPVEGTWITVGHAGVPRDGEKTVHFTREYSGHALYQYTPYRFLLKNDNGVRIDYILDAF